MTQHTIPEAVQQLHVPYGHLAIWALGQHGFLLKGGETIVIIDPYLSNSSKSQRIIPIPVEPQELTMVDVALITHHHTDHCDPVTLQPLLQAAPAMQMFASYSSRNRLLESPVDPERLVVPAIDEPITINQDLTFTAIPAAHYEFEPDAQGNPAYLGFLIALNGVMLYHSGDTIIYPGMIERLQRQPIDVMCAPINGRDWFREQQGLVGNLDYREAAELTAAIGAQVLIPTHNDLFAHNRINPAYLLDYLAVHYPRQRVHLLQSGELYYYVS